MPPLSVLSTLQSDPRGAPCGHHPECQAGSLHGHECRGTALQLGEEMRLSGLGFGDSPTATFSITEYFTVQGSLSLQLLLMFSHYCPLQSTSSRVPLILLSHSPPDPPRLFEYPTLSVF